ncbi:MAG: hypothetical protein P1V20_08270 [Verrucomicrobiales bacterium]|nr:hypothetical protein [Verrucomicrobiales bacterium]
MISAFPTLFCHGQVATGSMIAMAIASDSGLPAENYAEYGEKLALTLSQLSPEQFSKVFEGSSISQPSADGGDDADGDDWQGGDGGMEDNSNAPSDDQTTDQPLIDVINQNPALPPEQLEEQLLEASPLSEAVLAAYVAQSSSFPKERVLNVLLNNSPLPASVYLDVLTGDAGLTSGQLAILAVAQSSDSGSDDDDDGGSGSSGGNDDDDDDGGSGKDKDKDKGSNDDDDDD